MSDNTELPATDDQVPQRSAGIEGLFAPDAVAGVRHALEVMGDMNHQCLAPRHVLIGLARPADTIASMVLHAAGCDEAVLRDASASMLDPSPCATGATPVPESCDMTDLWARAQFIRQVFDTPLDSGALLHCLSHQDEAATMLEPVGLDSERISIWAQNARETGDPRRRSPERLREEAQQAALLAVMEPNKADGDREASMERFWKLWIEDSLEPSAVLLDDLTSSHHDPGSLDRAIEKLRTSQRLPDTSPEDGARLQAAIARHLLSGGRLTAALQAAGEAVDRNKALVVGGSLSNRPELAESLMIQAAVLSSLSRTADAVAVTEDAAAIYTALDDGDDRTIAAARADTLLKLGVRWDEAGDTERGLATARDALDIRRRLAAEDPSAYRRKAAEAVVDLSGLLASRGRFEEAIDLTERALIDLRETGEESWNSNPEMLGSLLNNHSLLLDRLGRVDEALVAAQEATDVLQRGPGDDLDGSGLYTFAAALVGAGRRRQKAGDVEGALEAYEQAAELLRDTDEADHKRRSALALALNNCGGALAMLGQRRRAQSRFEEAVAVRRSLAAQYPLRYGRDLSQSLFNLGSVLIEQGRSKKGFQIWLEALPLPADIETRVNALKMLLTNRSLWPDSVREDLGCATVQALEGLLTEIAAVSLGTRRRRDRVRAHAQLAGIGSEGAIFLAIDRQDPVAALRWLAATTAVESRLVAESRSTEFKRLRATEPELAERFEASIDHAQLRNRVSERDDPGGLLDDPEIDLPWGEQPATVIEEIRQVEGFENYLLPLAGESVVGQLAHRPTVVILVGEEIGLALSVDLDGEVKTHLVGPDRRSVERMVVDAGGATASGQRALLNRLRLRRWANGDLLSMLTALSRAQPDGLRLRVVPVGLANWIPIQAVAGLGGVPVDIDLVVAGHDAMEQQTPFRALVAHSHGDPSRHDDLSGAEAEAARLADALHVTLLTDGNGATPARVARELQGATFVHLACHGSFDLDDPDLGCLYLGAKPLTLERINEALAAGDAPQFVGLSSCHSGFTEHRSPEQASSLVANFLAHGTRTVLATQCEVSDRVAKAMVLTFLHRWSRAGSAADAFQAAVHHVAHQIQEPALATSIEAFCLYGDGNLRWFGPALDLSGEDERLDEIPAGSPVRSDWLGSGPALPLTGPEETELAELLAGHPIEPFRAEAAGSASASGSISDRSRTALRRAGRRSQDLLRRLSSTRLPGT